MTKWVRFEHDDKIRIGRLEGDYIEIYRGNLFSSPVSIDDEVPLEAVQLLTPVVKGFMTEEGYRLCWTVDVPRQTEKGRVNEVQ